MSSRTVDLPTTAPSSAAGAQSFPHPSPVCTEIGVSVQGSSHASGEGQTSHPFLEQTTTVIVFAQGGVVRLSETVAAGQILIVRHLTSNQEAACRIVSVKSNPNVKGYVEIEFLQAAPGFWGMDFPSPESKAASATPAAPEAVVESPKPAVVPKPASPAPAARYTPPPSEEGNGATGPGLSFLPDLLDTLALPGETKLRAPEVPVRPVIARSAKDAAPAKPPVAPWSAGLTGPATAKADATKVAPAADGRYISDLLDTLTPIGETILRGKPKSVTPAAPSTQAPPAPAHSQSPFLPPASVTPTPASLLETGPAESAKWVQALPPVPVHVAPASPRAAAHAGPSVGAEVAPMLYRSPLLAGGEASSGGNLLVADPTLSHQKRGWPTPMRVLAAAAAIAVVLAAGAGVYRWEKKARPKENLAASNQPVSAAPAPASAAIPPAANISSTAKPVAGAVSAAETHATAPNSSATAQPNTPAKASSTKSASAPPAPRGPAVASMKMSAPTVATPTASQAAPNLTAGMPGSIPGASDMGMLPGAVPSRGPAAPTPVRTSTGVQSPRLLSAASPSYPEAARSAHVQGDVSVDILVDENGKVAGMTILSGPTLLRQAALEALRQRKYLPAMLDGKPTSAHVVVAIHFQL